jgi:hypothetical protein
MGLGFFQVGDIGLAPPSPHPPLESCMTRVKNLENLIPRRSKVDDLMFARLRGEIDFTSNKVK